MSEYDLSVREYRVSVNDMGVVNVTAPSEGEARELVYNALQGEEGEMTINGLTVQMFLDDVTIHHVEEVQA